MAEIYKVIHPNKYYNHYLSLDRRPDGRDFDSFRPVIVNVDSFQTADASSLVKFGNTTAACGIKLELATPKAEEPDVGFFIVNVELPAVCSPKYRPGPPPDHAQVLGTMLNEVVAGSKCLDLKQLCILEDKLAWVMYVDVTCLDYDGSVFDSCVTSLMAALKTLKLPKVDYNVETEEIVVDPTSCTPLKLDGFPITSSFAIYKDNDCERIVTDPNSFEEELSGGAGANLTVCCNKGKGTLSVQKVGGHIVSTDALNKLIRIAEKKANLVQETIETAIKNKKT